METTNTTFDTPSYAPASLIPEPALDESQLWAALRQVMDPELDCNLVDLGLIYNVTTQGSTVHVDMTLTTAGCPMHQTLAHGVRMALLRLDGVEEVKVQIVWDPPWSPERMTEEGRLQLGMFC